MLRWAFLVLSVLLLLVYLVSASSSLIESSHALCMQDSLCVKRFYLHKSVGEEAVQDVEAEEYDSDLFAQLFDKMMKEQGMEEEDVPELDLDNQNVRLAWLLFLRSQSFCKDANQIYELDHGCQCKEGKHCNNECLHKMTFDTTSVAIAIAVIGAMLLWLLHWQGYRTDRLYDYVKRVEEKTQRVLDAQQVTVFVLNSPNARKGGATRTGLRPRTAKDLRV